jgi:hypothetical protein
VKITGAVGCDIESFKTFLTETIALVSYRNKQNMPVDETVVAFPDEEFDAFFEAQVALKDINMEHCERFLDGFELTAVEPDLSPAFVIVDEKFMHNKNYPGLVAGNFVMTVPLL